MNGHIHVYTENGKGKTTAALGLALRAAGAGMRVFIACFLKGRAYSEDKFLARLRPAVTVRKFGRGCFIRRAPSPADVAAARKGLKTAEAAIRSGKYGLVILDEAAAASHVGLFPVAELLRLADLKPRCVELVITGRGAHPSLKKRADLVTKMHEVKHYYRRGVKARKGSNTKPYVRAVGYDVMYPCGRHMGGFSPRCINNLIDSAGGYIRSQLTHIAIVM